jgi:hypothetical protein
LKEKEMCMIGIPPEDGDYDTDVEFEDDMKVTQTDVGDVTPRMDLENEAVSPWSIQSPEAKRLKIREEMRQEEFNEEMDRFFDDKGLFLDMNRVKPNGIKPRMASQEKTGSRGLTMEVRDLPLMPSSASLSSTKSLHRLEMRKFPFEGTVLKMNEMSRGDFERIREMHEQKYFPEFKKGAAPVI